MQETFNRIHSERGLPPVLLDTQPGAAAEDLSDVSLMNLHAAVAEAGCKVVNKRTNAKLAAAALERGY